MFVALRDQLLSKLRRSDMFLTFRSYGAWTVKRAALATNIPPLTGLFKQPFRRRPPPARRRPRVLLHRRAPRAGAARAGRRLRENRRARARTGVRRSGSGRRPPSSARRARARLPPGRTHISNAVTVKNRI